MANTYSQIYIQAVFAVKYRENLIAKTWKEELNKYISGIITEKGQKSIIVNGVEDHIHVFFGLKPSMAISDLMRDIKNNSAKFINDNHFTKKKFRWQEGFGAFSYSDREVEIIYNYIKNQEEHHRQKTFKQEYIEQLKEFDIPFTEEYLFEWVGEGL